MIHFIIALLHLLAHFQSTTGAVGKPLFVTGKNNANFNILGYSSYRSYTTMVEELLSDKIKQTYNYALQFSDTFPSVLLSRITPEKLIFLQFLHSFERKSCNFTDFLIHVSNQWSFNPSDMMSFLNTNFDFPPDKIYQSINFIANKNVTLPKKISEQIFFLKTIDEVLKKAATTGDYNVTKWLFIHGIWKNRVVDSKIIEETWKNGHVKVIELFMEYGKIISQNLPISIVSERFGNNETLLHVASRCGYSDTVKLLVTTAIDINSKDNAGKSSLYRAVEMNKHTVVNVLIGKGANIISEPLLALAVVNGHIETAQILVKYNVPLHAKDENGNTPLFLAVENNYVQLIEILVNDKEPNKSLMDSSNELGDTLLHVAASKGFLQSVKSLIKLGAVVNAKNNYGETSFYKAVGAGNLQVISFLIGAKADVKAQTDLGDSVVHLAASIGNIEVVKLLLSPKFGFSLSIVNNAGETPLDKAAVSGECEMLKFLVDNGGDITIKNDGFTMLHTASATGNEKAVKCIINNGLHVDTHGLWSITPLNLAVSQGHERVARILLERKADPNSKTKNNWSPLHRAVLNGHLGMIKLLREYNADINTKDDGGLDPFLLAVGKGQVAAAELIRDLFDLKKQQ